MPHTSSLGTQFSWKRRRTRRGTATILFPYSRESEAVKHWGSSSPTMGLLCHHFFLSWAWGESVGADDLSTIASFFHNMGTDTSICHFLLCLRRYLTRAVVQLPCIRLSEHFLLVITLFNTLLILVLLLLLVLLLFFFLYLVDGFFQHVFISTHNLHLYPSLTGVKRDQLFGV